MFSFFMFHVRMSHLLMNASTQWHLFVSRIHEILLLQRLVPEVPTNENPVRKKEIMFFSVGGDPSKYLHDKF